MEIKGIRVRPGLVVAAARGTRSVENVPLGHAFPLGEARQMQQPARVSAFHGSRKATGLAGPQAAVPSLPTGVGSAHLMQAEEVGGSGPPVSCKRL